MQLLRSHFRPEFLNRIDDITLFNRIDEVAMEAIVEVQLAGLTRHIKEARNITIHFDKSLKESLARDGYDSAFGARPLKRLIQKRVLDPLALELLNGSIQNGQTVTVGWHNNRTTFA